MTSRIVQRFPPLAHLPLHLNRANEQTVPTCLGIESVQHEVGPQYRGCLEIEIGCLHIYLAIINHVPLISYYLGTFLEPFLRCLLFTFALIHEPF